PGGAPTSAPPLVDPLVGGTLGATRMAWVGARGNPVPGAVLTGAERFPGDIDVLFGPTPSGPRAFHVGVCPARDTPVAAARAMARMLHQPDAQPVGAYTARAGQTVDLYRSARL